MKLPKVSFSYNYSKGSYPEKVKRIKDLNQKIYDRLNRLFDSNHESVSIRKLESEYKSIMPESIYFSIRKSQDKNTKVAKLGTIFLKDKKSGKYNASRYVIEIPSKNNRFSKQHLPLFMHESAHLLDRATNGKCNKIDAKIMDKELHDSTFAFYDKIYYNSDMSIHYSPKNVETKTRAFIKNMDAEKKLIILNFLKQRMLTEKIAYGEQIKYYQTLNTEGFGAIAKYVLGIHFDQKISIIEKLIKEILLKERYEHAYKNTKSFLERIKLSYNYYFKSAIKD